jgi:3D (Asp-Asp-Asp) domain-containing protein
MKRLFYIVAAALAALVITSSATSKQDASAKYRDAHVGNSVSELKEQIRYSSGHIRFWNHRGAWALHWRYRSCTAVGRTLGARHARVCRHARSDLKAHAWLRDVAEKKLAALTKPKYVAPTGRSVKVYATAYAPGCGDSGGLTASGTDPTWGSIAVDTSVFSFGTHFHIPGYGDGTAQDTGGAIGGHHIDLWFSTCSAANQWGGRSVTATIY